jgi:hypothetical protein
MGINRMNQCNDRFGNASQGLAGCFYQIVAIEQFIVREAIRRTRSQKLGHIRSADKSILAWIGLDNGTRT